MVRCAASARDLTLGDVVRVCVNNLIVSYVPVETGEDKRIKEFYQSRGLERVIQPAGDGKSSCHCVLDCDVFLSRLCHISFSFLFFRWNSFFFYGFNLYG